MHAHASYNRSMRTTVEMKPEHRSALLALAARRGEKGLSSVLAEAIEEFLDGERTRVQRRKELSSLVGSLSPSDAKDLRSISTLLREGWR